MEQIFGGLSDIFTLVNFFCIGSGILLGIFVGAVPGMNGPMALALLIPVSYYLPPLAAISFLVGITKGACYGGSISGILLNTPGSPEAACTCLDGYPLAKKGKSEKALKMALFASIFGDTFSDIVLIMVAAPIASIALKMGPTEICSLVIFALTLIAILSGKSLIKGLMAGVFGIFIACVGTDPLMGIPRMTLGFYQLSSGIPLTAIAIGMLALAEIMLQIIEQQKKGYVETVITLGKNTPKEDRTVSLNEFKGVFKTLVRSSFIGTAIGALPGLGTTLAAFLGYGAAKKASKNPEEFGKGSLEGIAAAEAANNAVNGSNLIPLFTLGIPGNAAAAILIGAFMVHGITPGPLMFETHGRLVYGIYFGMLVANLLNLGLGYFGLKVFSRVLLAPKAIIYPAIIFICAIGAFVEESSFFSVGIMFVCAVLGVLMKKYDFSFVTFIIGFVLGPMFEYSLQQVLSASQGNLMIFFQRPVSAVVIVLTIVFLVHNGIRSIKQNRKLKHKMTLQDAAENNHG